MIQMTSEEFRNKKPYKLNKYHNTKVYDEESGQTFDSKAEHRYYTNILRPMKLAGEITEIEFQPEFELIPSFVKNGKKWRPTKYLADFRVTYKDGKQEIIDVKGKETVEFKLKRKLFEFVYEDLELKIVRV